MRQALAPVIGLSMVLTCATANLGEAVPVGGIDPRDLAVDQGLGTLGNDGGTLPPTGGEATLPGGGGGANEGGDAVLPDPFLDTGSAAPGVTGSGAGTASAPDAGPAHLALHEQLLAALNDFLTGQASAREALDAALVAAHDAVPGAH